MTDFEALDACLGGQYALDYWNEDGINEASILARRLSAGGWNRLREEWLTHSVDWQRRAAETFSVADPAYTGPSLLLLVDMVERARDNEVAVAAADSLRSLDPAAVRAALGAAGWQRLDAVDRSAGPRSVDGLVVRALLARLRDA